MGVKDQQSNRTRQALLVALLISVLLHQVVLTFLGVIIDLSDVEPEEVRPIMLVTEPPPEQEPDQKQPEPEVPPPRPEPPARPRPRARPVRPQTPQPPAETALAEPVPDLTGPPSSAPEPEPDVPPTPPKLELDWRSFERIFGTQAVVEREAYAQASLKKRRGTGTYGRMSAKVRRALTNNQSFVKPGNQEPLGNRQVVFHNYIRRVHETSIHPLFADSFLRSLPGLSASDPLNDMSLHMVAEFEIFESGHISEIRVIRSSGIAVFDAGAVDSIYRSSPFPPPPKSVLSWNNRVYMRWGFYRNQRKCGVFNVEPYILRAPGAREEPLSVEEFTIDDG